MEELRVPGARPVSKRSWNNRFWLDRIPALEDSSISQRYSTELLASREKVRVLIKSRKPQKSTLQRPQQHSVLPKLFAELKHAWEEAQIASENQDLFFSVVEGLLETKACSVVDFELKQTQKRCSLLQQIGRAVAQREETLSLLHYLCDYYTQTPVLLTHRSEMLKCADAISRLRLLSLQVVEGVEKWRGYLSSLLVLQDAGSVAPLSFAWEGVNYLVKMQTDLDFLAASPLSTAFQLTESDPFLLLCATCGSVPESQLRRGLVYLPSDTGKQLIPVAPAVLARIRLCEVVVMNEGRSREVATCNSSPHSPTRASFSQSARSASVSAPLPATMQIDPLLVLDFVYESLLTELIAKETKPMAYECASSVKVEQTKQLAKLISEKYLDIIAAESARAIVKSVFTEVSKAKLLLYSSNILDDIILQAISDEIPKIAHAAKREEVNRATVLTAESVVNGWVRGELKAVVREAVTQTISDLLADELVLEVAQVGAREVGTAEMGEIEEQGPSQPVERIEQVQEARPESPESPASPLAFPQLLPPVNEALSSAEVSSLLDEAKAQEQVRIDTSRIAYELAQSYANEVVNEYDYYAIAEEGAFTELNNSSLAKGEKSRVLGEWRLERLIRLLFQSVVDAWVEEHWLPDLCRKQLQAEQKHARIPLLNTSPSALRSEERIDYVIETFTPSVHSPRSYTPGAARDAVDTERSVTPDPRLLFATKLDLLLVFAASVELVPIEAWEEELPGVLFSYMERIGPPLNACVASPEALLFTMRAAINPQWYWLVVQEKVVGLVCFRDEETLGRVICEHFSCLDFRFCGYCFEEVLRWALVQYEEVRIRVYYSEKAPTEFKRFLIAKQMKWKTMTVRQGVKCMELGKGREVRGSPQLMGLHMLCSRTPAQPVAAHLYDLCTFPEDSPVLSELASLGYLDFADKTLRVSLRVPGSECRLELWEGRLCRCLRVRPEVLYMQFASRRAHPRGFSVFLVRTSDPCIALFLLHAKNELPSLQDVPGLLLECESVPNQSELWFPNFLVEGAVGEVMVQFTCARAEPSATVKVRRSGVVLSSEFLCGTHYAGLILTPFHSMVEMVLVTALVRQSQWDRVV